MTGVATHIRRPIALALLLVTAGTLSAVAVMQPRQAQDPDTYFSTRPDRTETGLKARVGAGEPLKQVILDFPEVSESLELQVMQRVGEEGLPLSEAKTLIRATSSSHTERPASAWS